MTEFEDKVLKLLKEILALLKEILALLKEILALLKEILALLKEILALLKINKKPNNAVLVPCDKLAEMQAELKALKIKLAEAIDAEKDRRFE